MLDFELLVLTLVAPSDLLHLRDGLVLLLHLQVAVFQLLLRFVSLRRQAGQRVSESLQLVLSRVTAGVGPAKQNLCHFHSSEQKIAPKGLKLVDCNSEKINMDYFLH